MMPQMITPTKTPWYARSWFTFLMLIFLAPVGWFLMWRYRTWAVGIKVVATFLSFFLFIGLVSDKSKSAAPAPNASASASAPLHSAPLPTKADAPASVDTPSPPDITVTAAALGSAYNANEVAADGKYKDKDILVSGVVNSIGVDVMGTSFVTLKSDGVLLGVQCMFDDQYKPQLAKLQKGNYVKVRGTCKGNALGIGITVADCILRHG